MPAERAGLHVIWCLTHSTPGGVPAQLLRLLPAIRARGVAVTVAAPPGGELYPQLAAAADAALALPLGRLAPGAAVRLARHAVRHDAALLHSYGKGAGLAARCAGRWARRPVIHAFRGFSTLRFGALARPLYLWLERALGHWSAALVAVSPSEADAVARAGIAPRERLRILVNGIDGAQLRAGALGRGAARRRLGVPEDVPVVGTLARADRAKGHELLIEIAAEVQRERPEVRFLVLGVDARTDGYAGRLARQARRAGARIDWRPAERDAWRLLPALDLYLSTSRTEGLPNAPLEASALGVALLLSDVQGNRDVVQPGRTGLLYPRSRPAEAVRLITGLPGSIPAAHEAGPRFVEARFALAEQADRLVELYWEVAGRGPSSGRARVRTSSSS